MIGIRSKSNEKGLGVPVGGRVSGKHDIINQGLGTVAGKKVVAANVRHKSRQSQGYKRSLDLKPASAVTKKDSASVERRVYDSTRISVSSPSITFQKNSKIQEDSMNKQMLSMFGGGMSGTSDKRRKVLSAK